MSAALSVLIVSYNTRELTLACLDSVENETRELPFEVIVVDNASRDGSAEAIRDAFPAVRLIALEENIGFARATNLAAEQANGHYLVLLNPDTVVLDAALVKLARFMDAHPEVGACGGRSYLGDGSIDTESCWGRITPWSALCRALGLAALFSGSRIFDSESLGGFDRQHEAPVDVIAGCLLIIERAFWRELGGFDPRFFMYCEDQDLCLRVVSRGRVCWYYPEAEIVHLGGASEPVQEDKMVRLLRAKAQLFRKHWSPGFAAFGVLTLCLHVWMQVLVAGAASLVGASRSEVFAAWRGTWRRRDEWTSTPELDAPDATVAQGSTPT